MSNVLRTILDVKVIITGTHARGVPVLVDGSQAAMHMPVDVSDIGCDFYAVMMHKLNGLSVSGAIYVTKARLAEMRSFSGGGTMRDVTRDAITWNDPPMKFEAGTLGIVQAIGLGVAFEYTQGLGMDTFAAHERALSDYARVRLDGLSWLNTQGSSANKGCYLFFDPRRRSASS